MVAQITPLSANPQQWQAIYQLQTQAYQTLEPESIAVLQSKWLHSPQCCFASYQQQQLCGYLLAHYWSEEKAPALYESLPLNETEHAQQVFLHELAVSPQQSGQGVGAKLVEHFCQTMREQGVTRVILVALKDAVAFWQKQGFNELRSYRGDVYGDGAKVMLKTL